jgi:hypothetical protein
VACKSSAEISLADTYEAAKQIFVNCFPLLLADTVRRAHPLIPHPFQRLTGEAAALAPGLAEVDDRIIVTSAWLDLAERPVLLRLPNTRGRYFCLTLFDSAGEPFASVGSRTGDDKGGDLALVGPGWRGGASGDLFPRRAPSERIWAVGRVHARSIEDRGEAAALASGLRIGFDPRDFGRDAAATPCLDAPPATCLKQIADMTAMVFFHRLDALLDQAPETYRREVRPLVIALQSRFGGPLALETRAPELRQALARGMADGVAIVEAATNRAARGGGAGWAPVGGDVDSDEPAAITRAVRVSAGMGAEARDDTLRFECRRDEAGRTLDGAERYRIRFPAGAFPPARASWRLSCHGAGSRGAPNTLHGPGDLTLNLDGALEVIVQHEAPDAAAISNELACPQGAFSLELRLHWPAGSAMNGRWKAPPVERLGSSLAGGVGPAREGRSPRSRCSRRAL